MILYCCCLDVDDDTDSHPSSSPSCFGSFYFTMNISSRDRRINGVVADLRGLAFKSELEETSYYGLVDSDFLDAIDPVEESNDNSTNMEGE